MLASLLFEHWPSSSLLLHTPIIWVASIYMGLFSTAIAWIIYYYLIREWDAVRASAVMYVVPIMAIFWDFVFFTIARNGRKAWELSLFYWAYCSYKHLKIYQNHFDCLSKIIILV